MKHRKRRILLIVAGVLVLGLMLSIYMSANCLTVNTYTWKTEKISGKVKLVVLSDLHDHEFGKENKRLIREVEEQQPDLILLDGDMLNEDSRDAHVPVTLVRELVKIAPVYYAKGNHEETYMQDGHEELIGELQDAGAIYLDQDYVDVQVHGETIRIGGLYAYAFGLDGNDSAEAVDPEIREFLEAYQDTDCLRVMLSHRPDSFIFGDVSSVWKVELVISGHNHGGQVVLPFLGGVFGGDQGYFPKYIHGMYQKDQMQIFATSGLGSHSEKLPRINNIPEIAVIELVNR